MLDIAHAVQVEAVEHVTSNCKTAKNLIKVNRKPLSTQSIVSYELWLLFRRAAPRCRALSFKKEGPTQSCRSFPRPSAAVGERHGVHGKQ